MMELEFHLMGNVDEGHLLSHVGLQKGRHFQDFHELRRALQAHPERTRFNLIVYSDLLRAKTLHAFDAFKQWHPSLHPIFVVREMTDEAEILLKRDKRWSVYWNTDRVDVGQLARGNDQISSQAAVG